jgi:5-methyltetrahydrofolate--homocysteine methyltransferase
MSEDILNKISESIIQGDPDATLLNTSTALEAGVEPLQIIDEGLVRGMDIVGEKFSAGEMFLPHMVMAAKGMEKSMEILEPELHARQQELETPGTIVIGTVQGDIHEIGKSLVGTMLSVNGFKVIDMGVDVAVMDFVEKVRESGATFLGMSALLTTTMVRQRDVIEALEDVGIREQVKVMVGGAPVSQVWADEIGADGYAVDAADAVKLALRLAG